MNPKLQEWQKIAIAFAVSYIILFAAQALLSGSGIIAAWANTPTFYIMPIVGFFFAYFALEWVEKYFETSTVKKPWFVILLIIAALLAWHVALVFYTQNNVVLELKQNQQYIGGQAVQFSQDCKINALEGSSKRNDVFDSFGISHCLVSGMFTSQLQSSTYLIFLLSGILGWLAFLLINKKEKN